jgi:quinol-cytochrome oxidoreductase complex cytochrome b subunit
MNLQRLKSFVQFDTAGWVAISSLLICSISGVLLAIPYDFGRSYQSLFEMLMFYPAGTFIRNMHYWSAQLFFVTILLHIYDHLNKSTESNIKSKRSWLILCLVTVFLGYEMISGFILKGDAAGMQARRIVASLFESIPILGKMLSSTFTGSEDNWLVVYVQHIATGTIFLFIGIYEHVRTIWPKLKTFVIVSLILFVLSLAFRAPLGLVDGGQIKGPWFFVGIQEILHWISHPGYLVFLFLVLLTLLFLLPGFRNKGKRNLKRFFLISSLRSFHRMSHF